MIVGIVTEESKCFSTKQRVPYKIMLETIDKKELLEREIKITEKIINTSAEDFRFTD